MKSNLCRLLLLAAATTLSTIAAHAQVCDSSFLGTKTLYRAPRSAAVQVPAGYQPVMINYVGRHGARHLTKGPETEYIYKVLLQADSSQSLTLEGAKLKKMVLALQQIEKGRTKSISAEGRAELQGIARRLHSAYPAVFAGKPKAEVAVTKEIRTRQSAEAFVQQLQLLDKNMQVAPPVINDTTLRFYDLSPAYTRFEEKGDWIQALALLQKEKHGAEVNRQVTKTIFKSPFLQRLTPAYEAEFVAGLFGYATIVHSLAAEISEAGYTPKDVDLASLFTCNQLSVLGELDAAEDFLKKGPGLNTQGIQVRIAAPLLADFIKSTDNYLAKGGINLYLRFAHAETISPFATLLNLQPAAYSVKYIGNFNKGWQASAIIPLSANITWVVYQNANGKHLVQFLLNEKPVKIVGLPAVSGYFYIWPAVRQYYLNKLKQLGAGLETPYAAYLQKLED